jgi:hypothetical protein
MDHFAPHRKCAVRAASVLQGNPTRNDQIEIVAMNGGAVFGTARGVLVSSFFRLNLVVAISGSTSGSSDDDETLGCRTAAN